MFDYNYYNYTEWRLAILRTRLPFFQASVSAIRLVRSSSPVSQSVDSVSVSLASVAFDATDVSRRIGDWQRSPTNRTGASVRRYFFSCTRFQSMAPQNQAVYTSSQVKNRLIEVQR